MPTERPEIIDWLLDLAQRVHHGDAEASALLLRVGQALDLAGGAEALCHVQGLVHDASNVTEKAYSLPGLMTAPWEAIPSWRDL